MDNNVIREAIKDSMRAYLNEGKQVGELYHWTTFIGVYMILKDNRIKSANRSVRDDATTINYDDKYGVSFTRDKFFHGWKNRHYPMEACIVIDGDKLSNNYKLFPYNDFFDGEYKPKKKQADEMETRTNKEVNNVIRYIKRIELYHNDGGASEKEQLDYIKWFAPYKNVLKGFNYKNYTSIDEFKNELCEYIKSKGIKCIIHNNNNLNENKIPNNNNNNITVYHGTKPKFINDIKKNGLIDKNSNYSQGWYMVSTDFESALFHSHPDESDNNDSVYVVEFEIPNNININNGRWVGYPYLWKGQKMKDNSTWFALMQQIPKEFIKNIHKIDYQTWIKQKERGF